MKKLALILLVLALTLTGCGSAPAAGTESTTVPTQTTEATTEATAEPVIGQEDMAAVALPAIEQVTTAEDGSELFRFTGQSMSLVVPDPDVADKIIIDFLTRQDSFREAAGDIEAAAAGNTGNTPYFYNALYDPTRIDHNVLSLSGTIVSWSGGSHPNYNCIFANYDMVTGDVLTLGSILTHEDKADDLAGLVIEAMALAQEAQGIWDGFESSVRSRFSGNISYDEAWFFNSWGLSFSFPPYEVAPYSSGVVNVTVPYEKLVGIIEDAFFPVERDTATGAVEAALLSEANINDFSQIAELVLDEDGTMVLLYTDKAAYDVTIEIDHTYTAFATASLTPGDAVMLQGDLDEHIVILHYRTGDETCSRYVRYADGQIELLEDIPE